MKVAWQEMVNMQTIMELLSWQINSQRLSIIGLLQQRYRKFSSFKQTDWQANIQSSRQRSIVTIWQTYWQRTRRPTDLKTDRLAGRQYVLDHRFCVEFNKFVVKLESEQDKSTARYIVTKSNKTKTNKWSRWINEKDQQQRNEWNQFAVKQTDTYTTRRTDYPI